ncbi:DEAD/DEAH box helicase [Solitalea koreensis]|uniref:ATP dependent helicase, Lhr family n=1 Tax=Solitalea koreensis TaxID=543615 RepID=A0A521D0G0_9SPHI|nr:DEAD/DEAH box helicase [Solitalea koreensis]SMO64491.1 ATP dependent helicase, Lhr family [Solitalea koreensis]
MSMSLFHKVVSTWFEKSFQAPTDVQLQAWEAIKSSENTLIAAPTGSGKTLAAFLSAIDELVCQGIEGKLVPGTQVVYVSPLKALSNDIERNLQAPLSGIKEELKFLGLPDVDIEVMVRTGDTPMTDRAHMLKHPPHILVTTPESLYLLLTSVNGRKMLSTVHTLIIDEIHALVGDKRGSHLSLSVERLEALIKYPTSEGEAGEGRREVNLHRIGLSATQKPVEQVARFLAGNSADGSMNCKIIDTGHSRKRDLSIEIPRSPLTAVMANEVWTEIYDKLIELIQSHQTTLIFVNTRRLAERLSHNLNERLGPGYVLAHHGSMSKDQRFEAEQKLKSGNLKALVATASMELGIDVGSIDLVCQIGSSRSIAAFLQRVGRSGHSVDKTPKGKLFPLTCDELVECVAIMDAIHRGELDRIIMPEKPLDILAQQIIAEAACKDYTEEALFALVKKAYPYRDLTRKEFEDVITMLSEGFTSRRGRTSAYIYHDIINEQIKARKGARLTAIMSGGAIPDNFEYDVMLEPENIFLGTLNEDFAIESIPGDIFQLGNNSWKILRVENGKVRVADAAGQPPNIPFWLGEAPGRTAELSLAVSRLREDISERLGNLDALEYDFDENSQDGEWKKKAVDWLVNEKGVALEAADQLVTYLAASKAALKVMPSQNTIVMERFFDEAGDMHLVIHAPFGNRLNKAWGLALRKRFCRNFNFELQAAANDDAIILSLGSTHSFPLEEVFNYLNSKTVREILIQAMLDAPMFGIRWRWNASRALAVVRRRADRKVPAQLQRMQSEDLVAHVFPDQLACLENIAGDREVPDHPLVNQTIHDCLYEAMDIEGLETLLEKIKNNEIMLVARDLKEPSPLAHEILNARPYAFLDDAPLEERRTQAVKNRRWLSPAELIDIGKLDVMAIEAVKKEAWPEATNADELHDALLLSGFITGKEGRENNWNSYFEELIETHRATALVIDKQRSLWIATERLPFIQKIYPKNNLQHQVNIPERLLQNIDPDKDPLTELVRGRLEIMGPVMAEVLANLMGLPVSDINASLYRLENEGFVFRGDFSNTDDRVEEWCERRLLARIHRYNIQKLRSEIKPVSAADFMRFLFTWHQMEPDNQAQGPEALEQILQKLEGFEAPAAAWEGDILPARVADYDYLWLDVLCISGKIVWGRFRPSLSASIEKEKKSISPIKTTPITFVRRNNLNAWKNVEFISETPLVNLTPNASNVLNVLQLQGASFFDDLVQKTKLFPSQAEDAIGELISSCLVTSDSFTGMRALLVPDKYKTQGGSKRNSGVFSMNYAGRWSLLYPSGNSQSTSQENIEMIVWALLRRYGCVFRKLAERENLAPPWRDLVRVFRTLEARGQIRGGRFVEGVWGEQFALPEAIVELRNSRKARAENADSKHDQLISISAADPLNLTGILTPGKRISAFTGNRILYQDGIPVAYLEAKEIHYLVEVDDEKKWILKNALVLRTISPKLRKYLGKGVY